MEDALVVLLLRSPATLSGKISAVWQCGTLEAHGAPHGDGELMCHLYDSFGLLLAGIALDLLCSL